MVFLLRSFPFFSNLLFSPCTLVVFAETLVVVG